MSVKKHMLTVVSILLVGSFLLPTTGLAQEETWQRAYQAYSGGQYSEAERLFREVVEEYAEWGWAHLMLGITLQQRGKSAEALDHLQLAKDTVAEDAERFMVHNAIANVYLLQENYSGAISEANDAAQYAQNDDNRATVAKTKGQAYYWQEDWQAAVREFQRAAGTRTGDANVFAMMGRAQYELGDSDAAMDSLTRAAQMDRRNKLALYFAGLIYLDERDYDNAVRVAELAIQADPQDTNVRSMLGRSYLGAQRFQDAIQAFEVVLASNANDGSARYNLGQAYQFSEDWGRAIENYQAAVGLLPAGSAASAACLYDLGFTYEKVGRYEDALAAFTDSSEIEGTPRVAEAIARVEERIRRAKEKKDGGV
jgi:tetratricopeptide (TPR) repeat protein